MDLDSGDYQEKFSDYYEFVQQLGSGSFGKVVHAVDKYTGEHVAVKIISKLNIKPNKLPILRQEAEILAQINHPNVVKFKHVKETRIRIFLVMELIEGGDLGQLLKRKRWSERGASVAMKAIFSAIDYLHERDIIHRDLKPDNILVPNKRDLSSLKLWDFGLSGQFSANYRADSVSWGTPIFMAPEQVEKRVYSQSVDIWSCGIILYMLLHQGQHPLHKKHDDYNSYAAKLKNPQWVFRSRSSDLVRNLFLHLTKPMSIERYVAKQALAHPWINGNSEEIPITHLDNLKNYHAEMKLKNIFFSLFLIAHARHQGKLLPDSSSERLITLNNLSIDRPHRTQTDNFIGMPLQSMEEKKNIRNSCRTPVDRRVKPALVSTSSRYRRKNETLTPIHVRTVQPVPSRKSTSASRKRPIRICN